MSSKIDTSIDNLGKNAFLSPIKNRPFVSDKEKILYEVDANRIQEIYNKGETPVSFELAGPREYLYFDPANTNVAIVTCGGLCPGLNNVIRSVALTCYYSYGIENIYGVRYGYKGFIRKYGLNPIRLTPKVVGLIHEMGGSLLASSRGPQPIDEIVNWLEDMEINILFTVGGDGTMRGAMAIADEIEKRNDRISVIGIPKTIDNDISYVQRSFGFETAFSIACEAIRSAHTEALGAPNGVGVVKLMGRHSGFIAANAALALKDTNFVLIPEVDFDFDGEQGLLKVLEKRLEQKSHAVIVVAEGAGQKYFDNANQSKDPSGNLKLNDIGVYLSDRIKHHFETIGMEINLKYIDPSYIIRSVPANPNDSVFCGFLAQKAVHAGMAGKTKMVISMWNNEFVHVPIHLTTARRKKVDPNGKLWLAVLESTGQPSLIND